METLYHNGKIITMTHHNRDEALKNAPDAIAVKNGVIAAVGTIEEVSRHLSGRAKRVDLQGKCLMPGFIDPHSHLTMNLQMAQLADVTGCNCFQDIIDTLKKYILDKKIKPGQAVMGFGYDHNFLKEYAQPDKCVLDQVSTENPVMIMHISGHLACVNSVVLAEAGITADTPNPQGGIIGRLSGSNEPSGYLEEGGMYLAQKTVASKLKVNALKALNGAQDAYVRHGVTTMQDGATSQKDLKLLRILNKLHRLKADVVAYPLISANGADMVKASADIKGKYRGHLKIGGYKLVLDGSPQGRSAWMSEPYLGDEEGYCAYPWMPDDQVNTYVKQAVSENMQLLAHCNGDAASEQYLNAYEKAIAETGNMAELRPVMIHCQTVRNDQLDRMAKLNMIASIFVGHVWYWGDVHMRNFGEKRGHHISPSADALRRGIHVNFHQDTPITSPDVLHSVWCAVNRISRRGTVIGADQGISVYDALRAVTIEGAYQYFEEDSKGSLETGKRADMVILDQSPLEVNQADIRNIQVLETIKDGKTIYYNNK